MWHALIWTPVTLLILLWSGLCWAAHGVLLAIDWRAAAAVDWGRWLDQWHIPLWLAVWLPMDAITSLKAWLTAIGPGLQDAVAKFPSALAWIGPAVWGVWGLGLLGLLLAGGLGSLVVSVVQRSGGGARR
jgi:hypothetical protein